MRRTWSFVCTRASSSTSAGRGEEINSVVSRPALEINRLVRTIRAVLSR